MGNVTILQSYLNTRNLEPNKRLLLFLVANFSNLLSFGSDKKGAALAKCIY